MKCRKILMIVLIAAAVYMMNAGTVAATVITVDAGGNAAYTSIQVAINASTNSSDIIEVHSGTYYENVLVNKTLTLRGIDTGGGKPMVDAGGNGNAIELSVDGVTLEGFEVRNSTIEPYAGIMVISNNNTITSNNASNNYNGIYLGYSSNNTLRDNRMFNNNQNFGIDGEVLVYPIEFSSENILKNTPKSARSPNIWFYDTGATGTGGGGGAGGQGSSLFDNDIDTSNLVEGKPIYYLLDASDTLINSSSNAGMVVCIRCDDIEINGLALANNSMGIYLYHSRNSRIQNNHIYYNAAGIELWNSSNTTLIGNNVSNNANSISLSLSNNSNIINNIVGNNDRGLNIELSYFNVIYHNNFINNLQNASDNSNNDWYDGYPSGGNYWSDYTGVDTYNAPDQDVPGSDGIGDTLHSISGGSGAIDSYPYVDENGWDADTTPPTVAITSHVGGQIVTTSSITIAGTASDDSGIATVSVNDIFATGTTHWNADITLAEGTNIIFVTAIDTAENRASDIISVIYAPVAANIVELKGKVANTTDIADIFSYNTNIVWSASNFAGFYHDSDYGIGSESLTILHDVANFNGDTTNLSSLGNDNRTIFEDHLVYDTITEAKRFEYEAFGNYSIIGIIGEPYFAGYLDVSTQIESNTKKVTSGRSILENGVLSKVLIDSDDKYTIATGDGLELKEGYVLNIQQVDLENNKAFIELVKDGKVIDADVAYPGQNTSLSDDIYVYDGTGLGDKDDYPLIIARIDVVFRGADTNAVVIEGLFQISDTTMEVSTGYEYGMMVVTDTTSSTIRMKNREYPIYLERDSAKTVMGDMMFKVVDNDALSFYPFTILVNPQVSTIAEPDEHAYVKGNIDIIGTAKGADFRNYAVELKNATDWMWIYPSTTPVTDGILTTLDTIGLADGAYVIRLNVIDEGYNTKSSSVNITIDNTKPTVTDISVSTSTPVINTSVNITARVSDFNLNNSSIFISGPNGFINNTPMTDPDDDVYSLDFTKISGYGRYDVTIIASDFVGNINDTETISFVTVMPPYVNESIDTTANNTTLIDALGEANATLDLVTSSDTTGGTLNITMSNEMPPQLNQSFELSALGKYISLNPSGDLNANIAWAIIKIYYTDAELAASSLDETSLVLRYYNETSGMWELIGPSGVNTNPVVIDNYSYSGYVWANVSHFSYYGAGGELEGEAGNGDSGNSGGNSGGGGGGGGSNEPSANIEINQVEYLQNIVKDTTTDYSFAEPKTPVTGVSFYTQMIPSRAVEVRVQQLYNHSVFAASDSPNIAYKYLNIISSLTAPKEISDIKIKFKVANGWIASNGIKTSDVVMYRWHDDKWNPLLTEITGSDTAYVYYTSNSPGFSPFCISTVLRGDMTDIVSAGVDEDMSHTSSPSKIQSDRIFETNESASGNRLSKLSGFGIIILIGLLAGIAYMLWGMRLKQGGGKNT